MPRLSRAYNVVANFSNIPNAKINSAFGRWTSIINQVASDDFIVVALLLGPGVSSIDNDMWDCPDDLGCTRTWGTPGTLRITSFAIHMNDDSRLWSEYSLDGILTHEAGHAVGMYHAIGISCPSCTLDDFPTMTDLEYCPQSCAGCGSTLAANGWLSITIWEQQTIYSNYAGAVRNEDVEPGDEGVANNNISQRLTISNAPNPFNPLTEIRISAKSPSATRIPYNLHITDVRGMVVFRRAGVVGPDDEIFSWDGKMIDGEKAPAGVYAVRVETTTQVSTRNIALLK
jgi:hypothetical protein